ncbi:MAG TPA: hypothetical protein V6D25_06650 [Leptolyngbyaceae cyanobacterium]
MQQLALVSLSNPFPSLLNKNVIHLEQHSLDWLNKFHLVTKESDCKRFRKAQFSLLTAGTNPNCQLEELKIANDWISWLFIWDEQCDMTDLTKQPTLLESYHKRFVEILNGSELTEQDCAISYCLYDIRQRIIKLGGEKYLPYFVQTVKEYFQGCVEEAWNRVNSTIPNINNYVALRRLTGAVDSVLELSMFCNHVMLPDSLRQNQLLCKLRQTTIDIVCWDNDVYSAYREIQSGDIHNLVFVISYHNKVSLTQALQVTVRMRENQLKNLLKLESTLPSFGRDLDSEVGKYISILHAWISGNLNWYSRTERYQTTEILTKMAG